ncbi:MAG: hypothetical protein A2X94_04270 [Bdellovibrionales bacterium GWB1_55_8]|nr:MAG: hypothetical protein A2X94_04270 [Bdellovibrionales bacterium GWB1_55_8]
MSGRNRKIIHVDMDAFFTSVEQRDHPHLRGRPVVVGGSPKSRGVVAAASYEARRFGIRSAMASSQAARLCPGAIFVTPNFDRYVEVSHQIREIFATVTSLVEPLSLDEAYLDVTENFLSEPLARNIARYLKQRIREETGLTASAGVGPNKFIAKVASDFRKPDGLVVIPPEKVLDFVEKLPVEKLWGVGPATTARLHELGLRKAGDIRNFGQEALVRTLGSSGEFLYGLSIGEDSREVDPSSDPKSCGSETTFETDILSISELTETIRSLSEHVAAELGKIGRPAKSVTLKVRYDDFTTITRSQTLKRHTDQEETIARTASELLLRKTEAGQRPIRLLGVAASGLLSPDEPIQLWFEISPFSDD